MSVNSKTDEHLTFLAPVSAKTAGDLDIQQNTVDPLHSLILIAFHILVPCRILGILTDSATFQKFFVFSHNKCREKWGPCMIVHD